MMEVLCQAPIIANISQYLDLVDMSRIARVSSVVYRAWKLRCKELESMYKIAFLCGSDCFPSLLCGTCLPKCVTFAAELVSRIDINSFRRKSIYHLCLNELGSHGKLFLARSFMQKCATKNEISHRPLGDAIYFILDGYATGKCSCVDISDIKFFMEMMSSDFDLTETKLNDNVLILHRLCFYRGLDTAILVFTTFIRETNHMKSFVSDLILNFIRVINLSLQSISVDQCHILLKMYRLAHFNPTLNGILNSLNIQKNYTRASSREHYLAIIHSIKDSNPWKPGLLELWNDPRVVTWNIVFH